MRIARVFPRRTNATPDDDLAFIGEPGLFKPDVDQVHVSVTFKWDIEEGKRLYRAWRDHGYSTWIGGPAIDYNPLSPDFTPGFFLKKGYVITSRGCPNNCWFCDVWRREGNILEIPITEGWDVLDSNLLACSKRHIMAVFDMLREQPRRAKFTGGLDPSRITFEIAQELRRLKPERIYTAYDTVDDYQHIVKAGEHLLKAGFTRERHTLMCYVLIGYPQDTFEDATKRLEDTLEAGFTPMAMLYRRSNEKPDYKWKQFQRQWARPAMIHGSPT